MNDKARPIKHADNTHIYELILFSKHEAFLLQLSGSLINTIPFDHPQIAVLLSQDILDPPCDITYE